MKPSINQEQFDKLMQDIQAMKSVIHKNQGVLHNILLPAHFKLVSYVWGIGIVLFSLAIYLMCEVYNGYDAIPGYMKTAFYIKLMVFAGIVFFLKRRVLVRSLQKDFPGITFLGIIKDFFSFNIQHMYFPLALLMLLIAYALIRAGQPSYLVPALSIYCGLFFNFIGSVTKLRPYLWSGYWYLSTGGMLILAGFIPPMVGLALSMGFGSILFALLQQEG